MTLAEDLDAELPAEVGVRRCAFGVVLDAFPEDAEVLLNKAAPGPGARARRTAIARVLAKHGHPRCGETTIRHHLAQGCACYR